MISAAFGAVWSALGIDVREAPAVLDHAVIRDREACGVSEAYRFRKEDDQCVAVTRGTQRSAARDREGLQLELGTRVQDHGVESRASRDKRGGHLAVERRGIPVEVGDLDALMDQVVIMRAGVVVIGHELGVGLSAERSGGQTGGEQRERKAHRCSFYGGNESRSTESTREWGTYEDCYDDVVIVSPLRTNCA